MWLTCHQQCTAFLYLLNSSTSSLRTYLLLRAGITLAMLLRKQVNTRCMYTNEQGVRLVSEALSWECLSAGSRGRHGSHRGPCLVIESPQSPFQPTECGTSHKIILMRNSVMIWIAISLGSHLYLEKKVKKKSVARYQNFSWYNLSPK